MRIRKKLFLIILYTKYLYGTQTTSQTTCSVSAPGIAKTPEIIAYRFASRDVNAGRTMGMVFSRDYFVRSVCARDGLIGIRTAALSTVFLHITPVDDVNKQRYRAV